jgi:hypothetical protein
MAKSSGRGFFAGLVALGRSVVSLGEAFRGKRPDDVPYPAEEFRDLPLALPSGKPHFENAQLLTEHIDGWHKPHPHALAAPSYAPAMTAFGLVFLALGVVTMWPLSVIGAIIFFLAIAKWIGELLHD